MQQYLDLFIDKIYPDFIDKYLTTDTMKRLKHITQFCGCDYTNLYSPLFKYTRFDHSLVVAHMTWHFTHDKKETIIALLHDIGTPCFAHCIDYVFGDYIEQESSEVDIIKVAKQDEKLLEFMKEDGLSVEDLNNYANCHILENKSPKLCTDRLDGILHTCYIWIHTHSLEEIKEVYDDIIVLTNEEGNPEIGFKNLNIAEKFSFMVYNYAKELQGNKSKYVSMYVADIVKSAFEKEVITLEDLYIKKEEDLCSIFYEKFQSWKIFKKAENIVRLDEEPKNVYSVSYKTKKRNAIPLVFTAKGIKRVTDVSSRIAKMYADLNDFEDSKYVYVAEIERL